MKKCKTCQKEKDESEFPFQKRKKQETYYRKAHCTECYNAYFRKYMSGNLKHQKRVLKNKAERAAAVSEIKLNSGCQICGYKKCCGALEYHHMDPKEKSFNISSGARHCKSMHKLYDEMDKCILLCANCHREVEHGIAEIPKEVKKLGSIAQSG